MPTFDDDPSPTLVVLGANPAWQRVLEVPTVQLDEVNRVRLAGTSTAGKGMNCARAATRFGAHCVLLGGRGALDSQWDTLCLEESVTPWSCTLAGPIRWAITLRDIQTHQVTELVEEGPSLSPEGHLEFTEYLDQVKQQHLPLAICGSFPKDFPLEHLALTLKTHQGLVWVDSLPLAKWYAQFPEMCPEQWICKLNAQEWSDLLDLQKNLQLVQLAKLWKAPCLVTRGAQPLEIQFANGDFWTIPSPILADQALQPIGAGDTFSGVFLAAWLQPQTRPDCVYHALAAASASCLEALPGVFAASMQRSLFESFPSRSHKWPF
jgi:fructose-1-phosphate kinase PfkB-like protein